MDIGPGEQSARLNDVWNRLTGRERGDDGGDEDMEERILDSAERPLEHPSVTAIRDWRNKYVAHQDARRMRRGLAGYEVFPVMPLVRAYWAVMMAGASRASSCGRLGAARAVPDATVQHREGVERWEVGPLSEGHHRGTSDGPLAEVAEAASGIGRRVVSRIECVERVARRVESRLPSHLEQGYFVAWCASTRNRIFAAARCSAKAATYSGVSRGAAPCPWDATSFLTTVRPDLSTPASCSNGFSR